MGRNPFLTEVFFLPYSLIINPSFPSGGLNPFLTEVFFLQTSFVFTPVERASRNPFLIEVSFLQKVSGKIRLAEIVAIPS